MNMLTLSVKFSNDSVDERVLWCNVTPAHRHLGTLRLRQINRTVISRSLISHVHLL